MTDRRDPLQGFSTPTKSWFTSRFPAPTPAQCGAWQAIAGGDDVLVISPTGSGKTLAAFLTAIDRITGTWDNPTTSVVYISPPKALAADVEKTSPFPCAESRRRPDNWVPPDHRYGSVCAPATPTRPSADD